VERKNGRPLKIQGEKSTKDKIFESAVDLFAERGYDGVSIRDIAAIVGIKESSMYKHYSSKDQLLEKIIDYPMARIGIIGPPGASVEELIVKMGLDGFMAMASDTFTGWMKDPNMVKIFRILCMESYRNEQVKKSYAKVQVAAVASWETNFTIMMKHKLIKPNDPKFLSAEFLSFITAMYMDYFLYSYNNAPNTVPEAYIEIIDRHVAFFVDSIRPGSQEGYF
jgi:AcrR family transcriptional regulator